MEDQPNEGSASDAVKDTSDNGSQHIASCPPKAPQEKSGPVLGPTSQTPSIELPEDVVRRLRDRLGVMYECWFAKVKVIGVDNINGVLTLSATGNFVRDWMQSRYEFHVLDAWNAARHAIGGPRMTRVVFRTVRHGPAS